MHQSRDKATESKSEEARLIYNKRSGPSGRLQGEADGDA